MQAELRELLSNYGPIDLLWFDWDGHEPLYDQARTYELVKTLQPKTIINNRLDLGTGNNDRQILSPHAEYYTPEQHVGAYDDQRPWESCMTTSRRNQWAWGGPQDGVKSLEACLGMLIRCAGGDGNLLLNVGPMPTGEIAPEQANLLKEMGAWLAKIRREHLRHARRAVQAGRLRRLDAQGQHDLPPRPGVARRGAEAAGHPREGRAQPRAERRQGRSAPDGGGPGSLRSRKRPPAAGHRRGARTGRLRARPRRGGRARRGVADHQGQSHGLERLPATRRSTAPTKPWTATATPAGPPTPERKSAWLEVDLGQPTAFSRAVIKQAYPGTEARPQVRHRVLAGRAMEAVLPRRESRREALPPSSSRSPPSACG